MDEKVNVLVVDDVRENHLVMNSVLNDNEINVINAMSGEEALSLCANHEFAVILMDVQMPGMDGFETAELLRSIERTKKIPIIFVTAISKEQKSIFRGYEIGAVDYLFKPIDALMLKSKVNIFKELYQQRRMLETTTFELERKIEELTHVKAEKSRLENVSREDFLTCTYNRRGIEHLLKEHWADCAKYNLPISLMMIDLDNFKRYNDHYGHVKGDAVLKEVVNCAKKVLTGRTEYIGRYGGEEFLVVLPNKDIEAAKAIATRIQDELKIRSIHHHENAPHDIVTVSMGLLTTVPETRDVCSKVIGEVDEALYLAKTQGRNRWQIWHKSEPSI